MKNFTKITSLFLVGLSNYPPIMNGLFVLFLLIYLMTLATNLLIFFMIVSDRHLHNPMYFFLWNLAFLDMSQSSVTAPRMLFDLITKSQIITVASCTAQVFFLLFFLSVELFLLSAMSCDRFIAICHPLHYTQIMTWRVCTSMASLVWGLGCMYSLVNTLFLLQFSYCGSIVIHNFICDLPNLLQITCTDTLINLLVVFIVGGALAIGAFVLTFFPYVRIVNTILKLGNKSEKLKAFSTCTSHLTVVIMFYGSLIFIYLVPSSKNMLSVNKLFSVMYSLINPLLNPLIYSLRNKDLKAALIKTFYYFKLNQS